MPYRRTKRYERECEKLRRMRAAKEQKRLDGPAPDYPKPLPRLRRTIIVVDYDHGIRFARMDLYRTNRIDTYDCCIAGKLWKAGIGWSRVLEWVRKAFPRVLSERSL
jgi:hypothetical protein